MKKGSRVMMLLCAVVMMSTMMVHAEPCKTRATLLFEALNAYQNKVISAQNQNTDLNMSLQFQLSMAEAQGNYDLVRSLEEQIARNNRILSDVLDQYKAEYDAEVARIMLIPEDGHQHLSTTNVKNSTCTESGNSGDTVCTDCGTITVRGTIIPAKGHAWGAWTVVTPATYDADGLEQRICQNDISHVETRAIKKLERPTSSLPSSVSEQNSTSGTTTSAPSGSFAIGAATYNIQNGTATIASPVNKSAKAVNIPATIVADGQIIPVTSIAPNAFNGMKNLKSATIGANIESIGKNAFKGCKKLKKVTFKTVKLKKNTVGAGAFKGIHANAVIKCPKAKKKEYSKFLLKKGMKKSMKFK